MGTVACRSGAESSSLTTPGALERLASLEGNKLLVSSPRTIFVEDAAADMEEGISRGQRRVLVAAGVSKLADLAAEPAPSVGKGIGRETLERLRQQARLQLQRRQQGQVFYEILPHPEPERGLGLLPLPSAGDLFLDLEGAPFVGEAGIDYLFGLVGTQGAQTYEARWAQNQVQERAAFEATIDAFVARRNEHPDCHVYHFGDYEITALRKMAGRYSSRVQELDSLLRARVFVNLHRVVTQGVRASVESYSIKHLEDLYGFTRTTALSDARRARDLFERALEEGQPSAIAGDTRSHVAGYNCDDCVSTLHLRDWLEGLRTEFESSNGLNLPRPAPGSNEVSEREVAWNERAKPIAAQLLAGLPEDPAEHSDEQKARWLLAHLLGFHEREQKPVWWDYYRLAEMTDEELLPERMALSGLKFVDEEPAGGRSKKVISHYRFAPQEHNVAVGDSPLDPRRGEKPTSAGKVVRLDYDKSEIWISRSPGDPHPGALIGVTSFDVDALKNALLELATQVLTDGFPEAGPLAPACDLLLSRPPRVGQVAGSALVEGNAECADAVRLATRLQETVLAVQGPPGCGKTHAGARMVVALLAKGKRVGITGPSHRAIRNFLDKVAEVGAAQGVEVRAVQKTDDADCLATDAIEVVDENKDVDKALDAGNTNVIAGTAWLFARPELRGKLDVLFIDEAGQVSLANALAVARAATSMVLLGDPQQLDQPLRATHPPGTDVSCLQQALQGAQTMPVHKGLFLGETWRLHPSIARFTSEVFYEDRLHSREGLQVQAVESRGVLQGSGLRFIPVVHAGNKNTSPQEVEVVRALIAEMLAAQAVWVNCHGERQVVGVEDVLVVAPYNAHVAALRRALPAGVRVGTVDKFQGREAPVVIYSMATSSAEDAPRGMEFLYGLNRMNVATSRARCLSVVVASPALVGPECRRVGQMVLANALCRFVEGAGVGGVETGA